MIVLIMLPEQNNSQIELLVSTAIVEVHSFGLPENGQTMVGDHNMITVITDQ